MPSHDSDQDKPVKRHTDQTLAQKVEVLQERVRKMGVVSGGSDDKAFMDEGWDHEALCAAIDTGLNSSPSIPADQIFTELRVRNATKS